MTDAEKWIMRSQIKANLCDGLESMKGLKLPALEFVSGKELNVLAGLPVGAEMPQAMFG